MTTGMFTYTSDQRFSVVPHFHVEEDEEEEDETSYHHRHRGSRYEDWILQIKYVQPRDAGIYECQVSTEPRISQDFYLSVVGQSLFLINNTIYYLPPITITAYQHLYFQAVMKKMLKDSFFLPHPFFLLFTTTNFLPTHFTIYHLLLLLLISIYTIYTIYYN